MRAGGGRDLDQGRVPCYPPPIVRRPLRSLVVVVFASGLAGLSAAALSPDVPIPAGFGPRDAAVPVFPGATRLENDPDGIQVAIMVLPPGPAPAPPIIDPLPPAPAPPPVEPTTTVTSTTETTTSTTVTTSSSTLPTTATTSSTTASSATTSTTLAGCVAAATFPSVDCRLSAAIGQADAGQDGAAKDSLLKRLQRAQTKANEAGALITNGSTKKGKKRLGAAIRKLKQAAALLESKRAKNAFDEAPRTSLAATVEALQSDLVTLRTNN